LKKSFVKGKGRGSIVIIALLVFDLFLLYIAKYTNQGLSLSNFSLFNIGNSLELIFDLLLISGVIFYSYRIKSTSPPKLLINFTVALTCLLFVSILSIHVNYPLPNIYVFDHPIRKVISGALFSFYGFLMFVFIFVLWLKIIGKNEMIYLRAVINSFILVMLLLGIAFYFIMQNKENNKKLRSYKGVNNIVVVLGAAVWPHNVPSPTLASRVDKAVSLYKKGIANKIQLTGSNAPGELSEAEVAYDYIKSLDTNKIKLSDVSLEQKTTTTAEQVRFIKNHLLKKGSKNNIIIVSDGYHLARVKEICKFYNINVQTSASNLNMSLDHRIFYTMRESVALVVFWFFAL
jgi:vancomycin permeability regulator SanA